MKHIYFVRHGLSEMNVAGKISGSSDAKLTKDGIEQAELAGRQAVDNGLSFDVIVSSPQSRAHITAKTIAQQLGYPEDDIVIHEDLRERHFGEMEGKTLEDFGITREMYLADPYAIDHITDMEKIADLQKRADQVLSHLNSLPHDRILIVSHGAFGRAFRRSAHKINISDFGDYIENAKIIKLI